MTAFPIIPFAVLVDFVYYIIQDVSKESVVFNVLAFSCILKIEIEKEIFLYAIYRCFVVYYALNIL
jgi:hypothetical protein